MVDDSAPLSLPPRWFPEPNVDLSVISCPSTTRSTAASLPLLRGASRGARTDRQELRDHRCRRWQPGRNDEAPAGHGRYRRSTEGSVLSAKYRAIGRVRACRAFTNASGAVCRHDGRRSAKTIRVTSLTLLAKLDEGFDVVTGWRRDRKRRTPLAKVSLAWWRTGQIRRATGTTVHDLGAARSRHTGAR